MNTLNLETVVCQAESPLTASLEDELVVLDSANNHYYGLEAVGSRVWTLLESPRSLGELVDEICQEYEVAPQVFGKDCIEFLEALREKGLISVIDNS